MIFVEADPENKQLKKIVQKNVIETVVNALSIYQNDASNGKLDLEKEYGFDLGRRYLGIVDQYIDYVDNLGQHFPMPMVEATKVIYHKADQFVYGLMQGMTSRYDIDSIKVQNGVVTFKMTNIKKWMQEPIKKLSNKNVSVGSKGNHLIIRGTGDYMPDCHIEVEKSTQSENDYKVSILSEAPRDGKITFSAKSNIDFLAEIINKLAKDMNRKETQEEQDNGSVPLHEAEI